MGKPANNGPDLFVDGTRLLSEERIKKLSGRSLRSYYKTVRWKQGLAHAQGIVWCCYPRGKRCSAVEQRDKTPKEIAVVKAFDFAAAACLREIKRRLRGDT